MKGGGQTLRTMLLMLLMVGTSVAAYLFYLRQLYFCLFFAVLVVLVAMAWVCWLQHRSTRMMLRMVEGIRYGDLSLSFSHYRKSRQEQRLADEINEVVSKFRTELSEKEERSKYYETLLDTVDSSLLVADRMGTVCWMNRAAMQDLCGHPIHTLDELDSLNKDFSRMLKELKPGEVRVIRMYRAEVMQDMAATVTEYSTSEADLRLVNLKNIRSVLEENEMEAWQKLVRVLTHEIMNSIAPIISLSETLSERAEQHGMNEKDYGIMLQGMQTIRRRSIGLLEFVENYRKLSRPATPVLAPVRVGDWIDDIRKLAPPSPSIRYIYKVDSHNRILRMDRSQMDQVLLNLLKNAAEACQDVPNPEVIVETLSASGGRLFRLSVTDNGTGILPEVLDKVFIPFFTTKPTGSGIGLSLCKQIVSLHGGSLHVTSEVGKGSCFTLQLPG